MLSRTKVFCSLFIRFAGLCKCLEGLSLHPVYVPEVWWNSQPTTVITNSKISSCAAQSQKAAYKEAFSSDETSGMCQILEDPTITLTRIIRFNDAPGLTKIHVGANRVRSGREKFNTTCRMAGLNFRSFCLLESLRALP